MKGNFAWGSYGRFSAGSWRILGGSSASSRLNFGKFSAKFLQVLGSSRQNLCKFSADRKTSKGCQKDSLRKTKRLPEGRRKAPRKPKRRRKVYQGSKGTPKPQKNESVFPNRFLMPPGMTARVFYPPFWVHFGSQNL